jgi:hypothetical protein
MYNCNQKYSQHVVYKITNANTGLEYIGVHSTNNTNDTYLGSGSRIKKAVKEHGVECFSKEILYSFATREEALAKEKELVNKNYIKSNKTYNISIGATSYLETLQETNPEAFLDHQIAAGKKGGVAFYKSLTDEERSSWHKKGRNSSSGALGKKLKIKDREQYKKNRVVGALKRKRTRCQYCNSDKTYDPGNLKKHIKAHHTCAKSVSDILDD